MKVLLTHSEGRLEGLAEALGAGGFSVTHEPLIATEFLPAAESRPAAEKLNGADWLLFTSRTTVQAWANLGLALDSYKIGAVGEGTADEVERLGGTVSLIAEPANAEGFLRVFLARVSPPGRIGFPCGEQSLPTLLVGLERAGFTVEKAVLYRTAARPIDRMNAELVVLASPSAVAALPQKLENMRFVALGPSTYRAIKERGWSAVEAQTPDIEGVVQAVRTAAPSEVYQESYASR